MNRRQFITSTGAAGAAGRRRVRPRLLRPRWLLAKRALMKVGDQTAPTNETHLKYLARYSVQNICGYPQIEGDRIYATVEELNRMVDLAAQMRHQHRLHRASLSGVQLHRSEKSIRRSCWRKARSGTATSKPYKP